MKPEVLPPENLERLRFPLGRFAPLRDFVPQVVRDDANRIARLPERLAEVLARATPTGLARPYRPDGWTAVQVAHHLTDSHMNAYMRFKLALTEDTPVIKPYEEGLWIGLPDAEGPPETALNLIRALHAKWSLLLASLDEAQWRRAYYHPETRARVPLYDAAHMYAWHGEHHLRHIEIALSGA